ncbi:nop53 (60s ribosomal biogenesis) protein, partial [Cystoisospora suis]
HGAKVSLKAFRHAIDNASRLIKDVEVDEEEKNLLRKAKHERLEAKIQAAKEGLVKLKIGRNRFIEPPPLAQLPEDLGGSLRTMKAVSGDGSAVASQMLSLQRRGLIELPPTGGASGVYLRRIQKERSRKLHSKRRLRRK